MKKINTFASAAILTMAAAGAHAVPVSITSSADILALPGATLNGTGTGDLVGGVLTYSLTNVTDLGAYGTATVVSSGTWTDGTPGTGTANLLSCEPAGFACGQITLGPQDPAETIGALLLSEVDPTIFTVAGDGVLISDSTWTVTPVPLPAAAWLFGSALVGLAGMSKRRKAKS